MSPEQRATISIIAQCVERAATRAIPDHTDEPQYTAMCAAANMMQSIAEELTLALSSP